MRDEMRGEVKMMIFFLFFGELDPDFSTPPPNPEI